MMAPHDILSAWQSYRAGEWMSDGACVGHEHPDTWFQKGVEAEAKRICGGCPVRERCAEWASGAPGFISGVWGGLSEDDRAAKPEPMLRGWAARYLELRTLGLTDVQIMSKMRIQPQSLVRQLERHGIPQSPEFQRYLRERRQRGATA